MIVCCQPALGFGLGYIVTARMITCVFKLNLNLVCQKVDVLYHMNKKLFGCVLVVVFFSVVSLLLTAALVHLRAHAVLFNVCDSSVW